MASEPCVEHVLAGDQAAAHALIERLYPTIMKCVRSHLPRRTTEHDLAQIVYLKLFQHLHQFSGTVPLEHWVARIAINTCLSHLKQESTRGELRMADLSEEEEIVLQELTSSEQELPGEQSGAARELVEKLLGQLNPDERLVITLLHLEEKSVQEISKLTGWSTSWVKTKAFRARQKMRHLWNKLLKQERMAQAFPDRSALLLRPSLA